MAGNVLRDGERVWIDPLPSFADLGNPVCTWAGAMAAALSVTARPLSAEQILALSGYAFHNRWCHNSAGQPTGCPGSVSLEQGFLLAAFSEHSGWQLEVFVDQGWDKPNMQRAIPRIIASIDAGVPAVIEDKHINASLLYGYVDRGEQLLLNTYLDGHIQAAWTEVGQDPAYAFVLQDYDEPPPFPEVFRGILDNAIAWWHLEHEPNTCGGPNMRIGRVALRGWARFYGQVDEIAATYPRGKGGLLYNSLMNYQHLYENRLVAASFLANHAGRFPAATETIRKAAELYRQEAALLASALDPQDPRWHDLNEIRRTLTGRTPESAFWEARLAVTESDAWTPEVQQQERRIMEQALELESAAIESLQAACAAIDREGSA
jgi:hypothetical protein